MPKYYADLKFWFDKPQTIEIPEKFIDDVVAAVEGQYTFIDNESGLVVHGEHIAHIDIYTLENKGE